MIVNREDYLLIQTRQFQGRTLFKFQRAHNLYLPGAQKLRLIPGQV